MAGALSPAGMLFRFFSDIIDGVAPAGVIRAVDLQCRILEDDVMAARSKLTDEAWSILGFRLFIWGLKTGRPVRGILSFPMEHIDFYKRPLQRLQQFLDLDGWRRRRRPPQRSVVDETRIPLHGHAGHIALDARHHQH